MFETTTEEEKKKSPLTIQAYVKHTEHEQNETFELVNKQDA